MAAVFRFFRAMLILGALGVCALAILALFGFAVPELDLLNHGQMFLLPGTLVAAVVLVVSLRGQVRSVALIVAIMGIAASANAMAPDFVGRLQARPAAPERGQIRLLTHNLFGRNNQIETVAASIATENPDIIVLQEFFEAQLRGLGPLLEEQYPYSALCRGGKRVNLGLYSKKPFEQVADGQCPANAYVTERTGHILAHFKSEGGKGFSVMTTHMDWPLPIRRQHEQLTALSEVLDKIEGPLVLAGDFNSTPWSYALREFVAGNDLVRQTMNLMTFPVRGYHFGAWRETMPFLPLDHVMTRGGIVVHDVHTGQPTASDHLPVVVGFSVQ